MCKIFHVNSRPWYFAPVSSERNCHIPQLQWSMEVCFPGIHAEELCYPNMGYCGANKPDSTCPVEGNLAVWSISQVSAWEIIHGLLMPPLHLLVIVDKNSSVSKHLTSVLTQVLDISKKTLHTGTAFRLALNCTVACVYNSILTLLLPKAS